MTYYRYIFASIFLFFFILLFLKYHVLKSDEQEFIESPLVNLVESTHIIRQLIHQNLLEKILEEHDPEQLSILLDNISPAAMAFESEVLSTTIPLVIVCYYSKNQQNELLVQQLEDLAFRYENEIKFVIIDIERLYSLAQDAEIEKIPTFLIIKDREEINRFEGIDPLENILACYNLELIS